MPGTALICSADDLGSTAPIDVKVFLPDGSSLGVGTMGRYFVRYLPGFAQLNIAPPMALDTGNYTCVASTSPTVNIKATVTLEVRGRLMIIVLLFIT